MARREISDDHHLRRVWLATASRAISVEIRTVTQAQQCIMELHVREAAMHSSMVTEVCYGTT